jgi:hypothetical protein
MACLRTFQKLNVQGRINATDYYRSLVQMTDAQSLIDLPVCYDGLLFEYLLIQAQDRERQWVLMTHEWRHLKMLKWGGRFLKPGGTSATARGELAFSCRTCPLEGWNLPDDYLSRPPAEQYVRFYLFPAQFDAHRFLQVLVPFNTCPRRELSVI